MTPCEPQPPHAVSLACRALLGLTGLLCFVVFAATAFGQTIVNPSFEMDAVPPFPGYGPITGWTGGGGINDSAGPFNYNSIIPDGQKVAFRQGAGTMHQVVSSFTPGQQYQLRYYENARLGTNAPNLQVTVGGVTVVAEHTVAAVGEFNPYVQKVTEPFTATAASLDLAFVVTGTGDFTVLLDKVDIFTGARVTNTNDAGPGSLRQAILDASDGATITFARGVEGTVQLIGRITIAKSLAIIGPGSSKLTLHNVIGEGADNGVLRVANGTSVSISGLTVSGGRTNGTNGAGIANEDYLTLTDVTVSDCIASNSNGGGIYSSHPLRLTLNNCTIANNQAVLGGGIYGSATINSSLITGNVADYGFNFSGAQGSGGGLAFINSAPITITNSTISGNVSVNSNGRGIYMANSTVTLTNTTVSGNVAKASPTCDGTVHASGGGVYLLDLAESTHLILLNSVVTNNSNTRVLATGICNQSQPVGQGGGIFFDSCSDADVTLRNSLVAGNSPNNDIYEQSACFSYMISEGYNLISKVVSARITGNTTGNIVGTTAAPVDARLAPLGFYGGATPTHALLTTSPAINAGNTANSPATDQRGAARVGIADMGAFELNNTANGGTYVMILPQGVLTVPYSYILVPNNVAFGSTFTYTVTSGALPAGITLSTQANVVTLSGTPTAAGTFDFAITGSNGTLTNATNYRLIVTAPNPVVPTVTAINPSSGSVIGSESVTITGTNFTGATGVSIGGTPVISFTILSATSITAVTPAHVVGTASVVVSNGSSASAANTLYTYIGALFTQPQFTANYTAGQNNVINSPNSFNLYTLSQVQSLNVGVPLLVKDSATGNFKLTIAVRKSPNLATTPFTIFPMNGAGMTSTINAQGTLDFVFPAPGNAAFFRLEAQ